MASDDFYSEVMWTQLVIIASSPFVIILFVLMFGLIAHSIGAVLKGDVRLLWWYAEYRYLPRRVESLAEKSLEGQWLNSLRFPDRLLAVRLLIVDLDTLTVRDEEFLNDVIKKLPMHGAPGHVLERREHVKHVLERRPDARRGNLGCVQQLVVWLGILAGSLVVSLVVALVCWVAWLCWVNPPWSENYKPYFDMRTSREQFMDEIDYSQFRAEASELCSQFRQESLSPEGVYYMRSYYRLDEKEPLPKHMAEINPMKVTVFKDEGVGMEFEAEEGKWLMYAGKTRLDSPKLPYALQLCYGDLVEKARNALGTGKVEEVSPGVWFVFWSYGPGGRSSWGQPRN